MKMLLMLAGIMALAIGLLFVGQGLGYIRWPASSFMINDIKWVYYGGGIALVGLLLIIIAQRSSPLRPGKPVAITSADCRASCILLSETSARGLSCEPANAA